MPVATHKNKPRDYRRARELRHASSPFEQKVWEKLKQLYEISGIKFRRQQPLSPYIADFACMKARLIVELDGPSHNTRQGYDQRRDAYLARLGFEVLRFSNDDVAKNLEGVMVAIVLKAKELLQKGAAQDPSPAKTKALLTQSQVFASSPARGEEYAATPRKFVDAG